MGYLIKKLERRKTRNCARSKREQTTVTGCHYPTTTWLDQNAHADYQIPAETTGLVDRDLSTVQVPHVFISHAQTQSMNLAWISKTEEVREYLTEPTANNTRTVIIMKINDVTCINIGCKRPKKRSQLVVPHT